MDKHTAQQISNLMHTSAKPRDFGYYSSVLKPELAQRDAILYKKVMSPSTLLKLEPFGVETKVNANGQRLIMRDVEASLSIFDTVAFHYYILKYSEILGLNSLLVVNSNDRTISYD